MDRKPAPMVQYSTNELSGELSVATNGRGWSGKMRQTRSTRMPTSSRVSIASAALTADPATAVRRAVVAQLAISRSDVVVLQRSIGNWVVQRILTRPSVVQRTLTSKEVAEKRRLIAELVKVTRPQDLGENIFTIKAYADALVAKVLNDPRLLRSIKGKDPYVQDAEDDDAQPGGYNDKLIREVAYELRGGKGALFNQLMPGRALDWNEWRSKDCVFAAILKVFGKESKQAADSPQGEDEDFQNEAKLAEVLGFNTGPVEDPVLLMLMERLGWPRQSNLDTWNKFVAGANRSKIYIVSFDMVQSGTQSHVVVVKWDGSKNDWRVFDRQGKRLNLGERRPQFADNPLDAWEVTASEAAVEIRNQLN